MSSEEKIQHLLEKYLRETISPEEMTVLKDSLRQTELDELAGELFEKIWNEDGMIPPVHDELLEAKFVHVINEGEKRRIHSSTWRIGLSVFKLPAKHYVAAAAIGFVAMTLGFLLLKNGPITTILASESLEAERLVQVQTQAGETKEVSLPDGSRVWLNASSMISYPNPFTGNSRRARLEGEAYFEIAKDKTRPFLVETGPVEIIVLGTHFNVNAQRKGELVTTTLFEGLVELKHKVTKLRLYPGQQAKYDHKTGGFNQIAVDTSAVMAWRRGEFYFDNTTVKDIMSLISQWYGVSVTYPDGVPDVHLSGIIPRTKQVTPVLEILEATKRVHFSFENNCVIVNEKK